MGPRPDVPGYADKLEGEDRDVLKLRPGITGPASLKYRLEDEQIAAFVAQVRNLNDNDNTSHSTSSGQAGGSAQAENENLGFALPENVILRLRSGTGMTDQELAVWYNDNVIYPDKVRLNCYYYRHYYRGSHSTELRAGSALRGLSSLIGLKCLMKDLEMIFATVLGREIEFAGEEI